MARYYDDPMQRELKTTIRSIGSERRSVVLGDTICYPEGGGQPGDRGLLVPLGEQAEARTAAFGPLRIADTHKDDAGQVLHELGAALPAEIEPGAAVRLQLDWAHRWDYMQQHTGQHVLSAALLAEVEAPTVSVHQGSELTTIEVDREELSEPGIAAAVARANRIIREDRPVRAFWTESSELKRFELRRPTQRRGAVRLVEIEDTDLVACGGVHLPRTGMLNLVHCVSVERIRGRIRLGFMIGDRALSDYAQKDRVARSLSSLLSAPVPELPDRARRSLEEAQEQRGTLRRLRERLASALWAETRGMSPPGGEDAAPVYRRQLVDEDGDLFTSLVETAAADTEVLAVLANRVGTDLQWALVVGSAWSFPSAELRAEVLSPTGAKGGGKPPIWRGILRDAAPDGFERLADQFTEVVLRSCTRLPR